MSKPPKATLVKSADIKIRTGWTRYQMRKARLLGWVRMIHKDGHYYYVLDSLDERFVKPQFKR